MINLAANKPSLIKSTAWVGSSRLTVRLLGLCSTFILARVLVPEDFGIVAVATGIVGLLEAFSELGFNQALVRFQDANDDDYSTAWSLNFSRGLIISILIFLFSYPLSVMLDDQRLLFMFPVIAILPVLRGLENPRIIIFEKKLEFNVIFKVMLITKAIGVLTTIILAFIWRTYWVLIVGLLVTDATRCMLSYYFAPCKVKFTIKSWRKLFGFSGWIAGSQMLRALAQRLDPVILAAFASPHAVGILHMARELSNMTFVEVAAPVRRVLFPALSQLDPDSKAFLETYKQAVSGLFMILAPVCVGFALTVPDIVPLVLGNQWLEVIQPIQFIMFFLTFNIIGQMSHSATLAKGHSKPIFYQSVFLTPLKLVAYFSGVAYYGLEGAIFAICFDLVLSTITDLYISVKATGISAFHHFALIKRSIVPLIAMCLSIQLASLLIPVNLPELTGYMLRLFVLVMTGILSYSAVSLFIWHLADRPVGPESRLIDILAVRFTKKNTKSPL